MMPDHRKSKRGNLRQSLRKMPSLGVSFFLHLVLLLLLSFYTLATLKSEADLWLHASVAPVKESVDFSEIEIVPTESLELVSESEDFQTKLPAELIDADRAAFGELSIDSALVDVPSDTGASANGLGDLGMLFGEDGLGMADLGMGQRGTVATFFGTRVEAKRILYMLDNSGSMQNGRLETMIFETIKSVGALTPKQHFYVIFYSDTVYPLFYPQPARQFVRATDKNKQRLRQWLGTVEMHSGNAVVKAIEAAAATRPDVVYFLSDGGVNTTKDGRKLRALLDATGRRFSIHTFGMGTGNRGKFAENMVNIAKANGGTFRAVDVPPAMQELAKKNPRAYHKKKSR